MKMRRVRLITENGRRVFLLLRQIGKENTHTDGREHFGKLGCPRNILY